MKNKKNKKPNNTITKNTKKTTFSSIVDLLEENTSHLQSPEMRRSYAEIKQEIRSIESLINIVEKTEKNVKLEELEEKALQYYYLAIRQESLYQITKQPTLINEAIENVWTFLRKYPKKSHVFVKLASMYKMIDNQVAAYACLFYEASQTFSAEALNKLAAMYEEELFWLSQNNEFVIGLQQLAKNSASDNNIIIIEAPDFRAKAKDILSSYHLENIPQPVCPIYGAKTALSQLAIQYSDLHDPATTEENFHRACREAETIESNLTKKLNDIKHLDGKKRNFDITIPAVLKKDKPNLIKYYLTKLKSFSNDGNNEANFKKAISIMWQAFTANIYDSKTFDPLYEMGTLYLKNGNAAAAFVCFFHSAKKNDHLKSIKELSAFYRKDYDWIKKSNDIYWSLLETYGNGENDFEICYKLGEHFLKQHQIQKAIIQFRKLIDSENMACFIRGLFALGECYSLDGPFKNIDKAREYYGRLAQRLHRHESEHELDDTRFIVYQRLAVLHSGSEVESEFTEKSRQQYFDKAIKLKEDGELYAEMGALYLLLNKPDNKGLEYLQKAIDIDNSYYAYYCLAAFYLKTDDFEKAMKYAAAFFEHPSTDSDNIYTLNLIINLKHSILEAIKNELKSDSLANDEKLKSLLNLTLAELIELKEKNNDKNIFSSSLNDEIALAYIVLGYELSKKNEDDERNSALVQIYYYKALILSDSWAMVFYAVGLTFFENADTYDMNPDSAFSPLFNYQKSLYYFELAEKHGENKSAIFCDMLKAALISVRESIHEQNTSNLISDTDIKRDTSNTTLLIESPNEVLNDSAEEKESVTKGDMMDAYFFVEEELCSSYSCISTQYQEASDDDVENEFENDESQNIMTSSSLLPLANLNHPHQVASDNHVEEEFEKDEGENIMTSPSLLPVANLNHSLINENYQLMNEKKEVDESSNRRKEKKSMRKFVDFFREKKIRVPRAIMAPKDPGWFNEGIFKNEGFYPLIASGNQGRKNAYVFIDKNVLYPQLSSYTRDRIESKTKSVDRVSEGFSKSDFRGLTNHHKYYTSLNVPQKEKPEKRTKISTEQNNNNNDDVLNAEDKKKSNKTIERKDIRNKHEMFFKREETRILTAKISVGKTYFLLPNRVVPAFHNTGAIKSAEASIPEVNIAWPRGNK